MTQIPFIDLKRTLADPAKRERILSRWTRILENTEFVGGKTVEELERALAKRLEVAHVVSCANGTDALALALRALGIGPGHKVALPDQTFWATYEAVIHVGATPILIDINSDDFQMDFDEFKRAHEKYRFEGALLPHLFGWASARLGDFRAFCRERGIALLEDGAQCFGVRVGGREIFAEAELATLSFYPAKVLGGAMDGGAIVGRQESVLSQCRRLGNHGRSTHYSYSHVGWNSRMGGLQAAFLVEQLADFEQMLRSRLEAVKFYREALKDVADEVRVASAPVDIEENGYLLTLISRRKTGEEIQKGLQARGIGCGRTYPEPLSVQEPARDTLRVSDLKNAREFCRSVINLPLFAGITREECSAASQSLIAVVREG